MIRPQTVFRGPHRGPNGLAADSDSLWICDIENSQAYKVRSDNGEVLLSFSTPAKAVSGIAVGGGAVWVSHNQAPAMVFKFDPLSGQCIHFLLLKKGDRGGIHGLEWDNGSLWVTRPGLNALHRIDPESAEVLQEIPFPGSRSHGIFIDGDRLACNDTTLNTIFLFDKRTGELVEKVGVEGIEAHGMTRSDDGRVWFSNDRPNEISTAPWPPR
jgi:sugar lactone lactonase YvrE